MSLAEYAMRYDVPLPGTYRGRMLTGREKRRIFDAWLDGESTDGIACRMGFTAARVRRAILERRRSTGTDRTDEVKREVQLRVSEAKRAAMLARRTGRTKG